MPGIPEHAKHGLFSRPGTHDCLVRLSNGDIGVNPDSRADIRGFERARGPAERQAQIERSTFDPWNALMEHRPLGDVMRARKYVYYASQKQRGATK